MRPLRCVIQNFSSVFVLCISFFRFCSRTFRNFIFSASFGSYKLLALLALAPLLVLLLLEKRLRVLMAFCMRVMVSVLARNSET